MSIFLLSFVLVVTVVMVVFILMQRSEGGALGIGGGASTFMSGRATANLLSRTTAVLAVGFMTLTLIIGILTHRGGPQSVLEALPETLLEATPLLPSVPQASGIPQASGVPQASEVPQASGVPQASEVPQAPEK